jgi:ribokinase
MCASSQLSEKNSAASLIRDTLRAERIATDTLIDLPGETDYSVIIVARGGENMIITSASQAESVTGRDVDGRVLISSGDALLLQGNLLPDPTLHAAKRAKQAGAKVIFNTAPYRD